MPFSDEIPNVFRSKIVSFAFRQFFEGVSGKKGGELKLIEEDEELVRLFFKYN